MSEERRPADEAEIPAKAQENEAQGKILELDPLDGNRRSNAEQHQARRTHPLGSET